MTMMIMMMMGYQPIDLGLEEGVLRIRHLDFLFTVTDIFHGMGYV